MNKKVLIIYTGGTIGMKPSGMGYAPDSDFPVRVMNDIGQIKNEMVPPFEIMSMSPLLDSSAMTPADWDRIAEVIQRNYDKYHGFIVLHGTDTMAYTSSALAFMLRHIDKNVIVTGSQIPYCEVRNDARENMITSLIICGNYDLHEVALYFNNKLLRGCRAKKMDATHMNAFDSPNCPPLAEIGVHIDIGRRRRFDIQVDSDLLRDKSGSKTSVQYMTTESCTMKPEVGVLRLFPGISANFIRHILKPPVRGLVLEAYGVGNGPTRERDPELFAALSKATGEDDIVIVAVTQCPRGSIILDEYAASLKAAGIISGYDMTVEAALAKLYFLISYTRCDMDKVRKLMQKDLRGELTKLEELREDNTI